MINIPSNKDQLKYDGDDEGDDDGDGDDDDDDEDEEDDGHMGVDDAHVDVGDGHVGVDDDVLDDIYDAHHDGNGNLFKIVPLPTPFHSIPRLCSSANSIFQNLFPPFSQTKNLFLLYGFMSVFICG